MGQLLGFLIPAQLETLRIWFKKTAKTQTLHDFEELTVKIGVMHLLGFKD